MSLLEAFLCIIQGLARRVPATANLPTRRPSSARFVALYRAALFVPNHLEAARIAEGAPSIFCILAASGIPNNSFSRSCAAPWSIARAVWSGWPSMNTRLKKTGPMISQAFYQRDPLSPKFHLNLILGLRFLQPSLLVPLNRRTAVGSRAIPIHFPQVSRVKKPSRQADKETQKQYKFAVKRHNLSQSCVQMLGVLRQDLDRAG